MVSIMFSQLEKLENFQCTVKCHCAFTWSFCLCLCKLIFKNFLALLISISTTYRRMKFKRLWCWQDSDREWWVDMSKEGCWCVDICILHFEPMLCIICLEARLWASFYLRACLPISMKTYTDLCGLFSFFFSWKH